MLAERPRDAAIRTLPIIPVYHRHIRIRIQMMLHMEAIPPAEDLITYGTVLRVHAPSMKTVLEGTEGGIL